MVQAEEPEDDVQEEERGDEDDEEEEGSIPEHEFEIKTTEGKTGSKKGVIREKVSLVIGNHIFRKRRKANGVLYSLAAMVVRQVVTNICQQLPRLKKMEHMN